MTLQGGGDGGVWNAADGDPASPQDVIASAAGLLGIAPPPEERYETAEMTPMARSFYADSKRVSIVKLGYAQRYAGYREGLRALAAARRDAAARIPFAPQPDHAAVRLRRSHSSRLIRPRRASPIGTSERSSTRPPK